MPCFRWAVSTRPMPHQTQILIGSSHSCAVRPQQKGAWSIVTVGHKRLLGHMAWARVRTGTRVPCDWEWGRTCCCGQMKRAVRSSTTRIKDIPCRESSLACTTHLSLRILSSHQVEVLEVREACRGSVGTLQAAHFTPNTGHTSCRRPTHFAHPQFQPHNRAGKERRVLELLTPTALLPPYLLRHIGSPFH